MDTTLWTVVGAGVLYLVIFFTGYWLSSAGKPYSKIILTIHKLISLAGLVLLVLMVVRSNRAAALSWLEWVACVLAGLLFLGTMATGGLLSTGKPMPAVVSTLHKITPFLTVLASAAGLFLLLRGG